jgi:hypothetical protein
MKIVINKGVVTATSESKAEALALALVSMSLGNDTKVTPQEKKPRPYGMVVCDICKQKCKGAHGLAVHKATKHKNIGNVGLLGIVSDSK